MARYEWSAGDDALLWIVLAAYALPVCLAALLVWIVIVVLAWERGERKLGTILVSWAIALASSAACIGTFFATSWASARWTVWRLDVESKPVIEAIERFRARNGHAPRSLEELVPSELDRLPARLAGCTFWFTPLDGEFDPMIGWYDLGPADSTATNERQSSIGPAERAVLVVEVGETGAVQELRIERARTRSSGTFDAARWRGAPQARIEAAAALENDPRAWRGHRRLLEELLGPFDGVTRRGTSAWELHVRRPDGYRELFVRRPQCDYGEVPELGSFRRIGAWVYGIDSES
ncbi:MAG: hypothetical protein IPJ77_01005 [Planctomycetes bacterium]|nr:hypothetical protein [Planctomycetota bacterium]